MTINDLELYVRGLWDWGILDGCFGDTKIRPTDIDGYIEHNGCFLFIEAKSPGANLPFGQEKGFKELIKALDGRGVYFVVWGERNKPEKMRVYYVSRNPDGKSTLKISDDTEDIDSFRQSVCNWYKWTEKK